MAGDVDRGDPRKAEVPLEIGVDEGGDEGPGRAVDVHGDVEARVGLQGVERVADLLDRLVRAVERRAEHRDDSDGVLVAELHRLVRGDVQAIALHRHQAHLDVPVVGELLPADLDVDSHDDVGRVDRLALCLAPMLPASLEGEPAQHRRLARAGRRAAGGLIGVLRVPQAREDRDAAHLELGGLRVLVLVDHVLVEALGHERLRLRLHPGGDERRQVEAGVAVDHQLVVDDLVGHVRRNLALGDPVARNLRALKSEQGCDAEIVVVRPGRSLRMAQRHA